MGLKMTKSSSGNKSSGSSTKKYVGGVLVSGGSSGGSSSGAKSTTTQQTTAPQTTAPATTTNTSGGTSGSGTYDASKNYSKLIEEAVAKGDYRGAAQLEVERNYKVDDMNSKGTNTNGYTTTNNYAGWLDTTDYGTLGKQQMAGGASAADVQKTYNDRYNKADGTIGLQQYADDELMQQMLDYINSAQDTELPEFDEEYWYSNQPTFNDNYAGISEELFNKILSREGFKYNPADDPLYGYYEDMYRREGDRARENTLADIAASAGGMNSWAVTAAQQAQNNYNAQLGDKIPELYQLAYQMYLNEKASEVENLGLVNQMSDRQYNRYMDQMGIWRDDRDFSYGMYRDNMGDYQWGTGFNYGVNQDLINNAWKDKEWDYGVIQDQYNREQAENEIAYNREQEAQQNARAWALDLIAAGVTPDPATLQQAGLTLDQAKQILANEQASGSRSSGGSSGGSSSSSSTTMNLDGLFEAALASGAPEVFLQNSSYLKKYGVGKYSDELVGAYEEWTEERENAQLQRVLEASTTNLGIGPVDADWVENTLKPAGAVVVTADGYAWANGWNANNYKEKLNGAAANKLGFLDPNAWTK